ncbi:hypothetical protein GCM10027062_28050 [Nocardioides hungaricus]
MDKFDDLDAAATLAAAESALARRRAAEVDDLLLLCQWADLHATDPRKAPGGDRAWCGEDRLVEVGGDGTPLVQELCLPELAIARQVHTLSARAAMADALDLRHRLPRTWTVVLGGECEPWLARKVASLSRGLDRFKVPLVDDAVADAIAGESPARVLELARAKVIEADPAAYAARLDAELRKRFVSLTRTDEHGLRHVIGRVEAGAAVWIDALVQRVADVLARRRDLVPHLPADVGRDELRAEAFGWLAHPERVLELFDGAQPSEARPAGRTRAHAIVHVHLHEAALHDRGVARVEELGPLLVEQVRRLLGHAHVDLKPVVDLADTFRVNAYEHPESVKERVHLRTVGEVFPHASRVSRKVDMDHPVEWRADGSAGQTGDDNAAPLGRTHHRVKTHLGYRLRQLGPDDYVWRTPHGLYRRVGSTGTHPVDPEEAEELMRSADLQRALDQIERELGRTA